MHKTLALILLACSAYAAGLTGKWSGTLEELNPDGSVRRTSGAYMDLTLSGETVTLSAKFDLVFDGETIRGSVALSRGSESRTARVALKPADRAAGRAAIRAHIGRIFR